MHRERQIRQSSSTHDTWTEMCEAPISEIRHGYTDTSIRQTLKMCMAGK